jgi:hypothetical protein
VSLSHYQAHPEGVNLVTAKNHQGGYPDALWGVFVKRHGVISPG